MSKPDARFPDTIANEIMALFTDYVSDDTQMSLDDAVYDWAANNEDVDSFGEADPELTDSIRSSATASEICNQGPRGQIRTLAKWGMKKQEIVDLFLNDPKLSQHARIKLKQIAGRP